MFGRLKNYKEVSLVGVSIVEDEEEVGGVRGLYKVFFWGDVIKILIFKRLVENSFRRERKVRLEDGRIS